MAPLPLALACPQRSRRTVTFRWRDLPLARYSGYYYKSTSTHTQAGWHTQHADSTRTSGCFFNNST
jgi:hypothetical protein